MEKVKPEVLYADDVVVSFAVRQGKKNTREKEAIIRLSFVDSLRKEVVAEIALLPLTARALVEVLQKTLEKLQRTLEGKEETKKKEDTSYIA